MLFFGGGGGVVVEVEVGEGGGGGLWGAGDGLGGWDGADGEGRVQGGLFGDASEEVGEGLGGDDGGVAEVFEFLGGWSVEVGWGGEVAAYGFDGADGSIDHGRVHVFHHGRHDKWLRSKKFKRLREMTEVKLRSAWRKMAAPRR
ncbi:hypothetical protein Tdes44962_MAKER08714 [Teratosphaeria destructans]|uniref:Uncharacterized protein n=1 Tax=Teratosphaeria destructans TaxID=418781 RepID=A0A9W7W4K8_9PEZI|nr:hypothetical protein Tdes44962_MAKER08714 [Teratosphaeria destructans]